MNKLYYLRLRVPCRSEEGRITVFVSAPTLEDAERTAIEQYGSQWIVYDDVLVCTTSDDVLMEI